MSASPFRVVVAHGGVHARRGFETTTARTLTRVSVRHDLAVSSRWVGTPPEGRHSRERAKPEFWWRQRPVVPALTGIAIVVAVVVLIALLS
jgi:hypothetical protein